MPTYSITIIPPESPPAAQAPRDLRALYDGPTVLHVRAHTALEACHLVRAAVPWARRPWRFDFEARRAIGTQGM